MTRVLLGLGFLICLICPIWLLVVCLYYIGTGHELLPLIDSPVAGQPNGRHFLLAALCAPSLLGAIACVFGIVSDEAARRQREGR